MIFEAIIFVATGILSTLVGQLLLLAGAGDAWTMLLPLSNYAGMAAAGLVPASWSTLSLTHHSATSSSDIGRTASKSSQIDGGVSPAAAAGSTTSISKSAAGPGALRAVADHRDGAARHLAADLTEAGADSLSLPVADVVDVSSGGLRTVRLRAAPASSSSVALAGGGLLGSGGGGATPGGGPGSTHIGDHSGHSTPHGGLHGSSSSGGGLDASNVSFNSQSSVHKSVSVGKQLHQHEHGRSYSDDSTSTSGSSGRSTSSSHDSGCDAHNGDNSDGIYTPNGVAIGGGDGAASAQSHVGGGGGAATGLLASSSAGASSLLSSSRASAAAAAAASSANVVALVGRARGSYRRAITRRGGLAAVALNQCRGVFKMCRALRRKAFGAASSASSKTTDVAFGSVVGPGADGSITSSSSSFSISTQTYVIAACFLDILGYWLHVQGLKYAGSALFQVLYSSVVVWAALGSRIVRGPVHGKLNTLQMLGIGVVLLGLAYSALAEGHGGGAGHGDDAHGSSTSASVIRLDLQHRSSSHDVISGSGSGSSSSGYASPGGDSDFATNSGIAAIASSASSSASGHNGHGYMASNRVFDGAGGLDGGDAAGPVGGVLMAGSKAVTSASIAGGIAGGEHGGASAGSENGSSTSSSSPFAILIGIAASLASALTYGTVYTLAELLMSQPKPPAPSVVSTRVGGGITTALSIYALFIVLPRFGEITARVADAGILSWPSIIFCYGLMMGSALLHSITYYQLMHGLGAVAAGVMQAARVSSGGGDGGGGSVMVVVVVLVQSTVVMLSGSCAVSALFRCAAAERVVRSTAFALKCALTAVVRVYVRTPPFFLLLQAVGVFVVAGFVFCRWQSSQVGRVAVAEAASTSRAVEGIRRVLVSSSASASRQRRPGTHKTRQHMSSHPQCLLCHLSLFSLSSIAIASPSS